MWVLMASLASAGQVTAADFGKMATELVPQIERASGRSFEELPVLELTDFPTYWNEYAPKLVLAMKNAGFSAQEQEDQLKLRVKDLESTLALALDGRIYVLADRIEEAYREDALPDDVLRPAMRCLLAHELVHILQEQGGLPDATTKDDYLDRAVMLEGHAEYVAEVVCRADGELAAVGLMRGWKGTEAVESLVQDPSQVRVRYGYGRVWAEQIAAEHGARAIWDRYAEPPHRDELVESIRSQQPADPVSLEEIGTALQPDATQTRTDMHLLAEWRNVGPSALESLSEVTAVHAIALDDQLASGLLYRVQFEGADIASSLLEARREYARVERVVRNKMYVETAWGSAYGFAHKTFVKPFPQLDKLRETEGSMRISYVDTQGKFPPSHEYWVADGNTAVVFLSRGESRVFPRAKVAQAMVDALGGSAP